MAQMRSADRVRKRLLFGIDRTYRGHHETDAFDPGPTTLAAPARGRRLSFPKRGNADKRNEQLCAHTFSSLTAALKGRDSWICRHLRRRRARFSLRCALRA